MGQGLDCSLHGEEANALVQASIRLGEAVASTLLCLQRLLPSGRMSKRVPCGHYLQATVDVEIEAPGGC